MKLLLVSVLFAVASLAAGQLPTAFQYNQQFGRGIVAPSVASFEPNRTFRLKQVPVQQSVFFPVQSEVAAAVVPTPAIVAPIPVLRAVIDPIPVAPPATVAIENTPAVAPVASHKTRRVVKKVRVISEKPVQVANVVFPDTPEPRALNNEQIQITAEEEKLLREAEEAKNAHYSFSSSSQDSIYDNAISRSETRDGLALTGMYSYSDGFFKRTVHYQADQDGYRVVK